MGSGKAIRTKISNIRNIRKITSAMELVAASKMRLAQTRMFASRAYARKIRDVVGRLAKAHSEYRNRYLAAPNVRRVGLIVITSDRGLCGSLNSNLFRKVLAQLKQWHADDVTVKYCLIGRKAEAFFRRLGSDVLAQASHLGDKPKVEDVVGIVKVMLDAFAMDELDAVYIVYNEFINTMSQKPLIQQLLPLEPDPSDYLDYYWDYIYEPDASEEILGLLIKRYLESQLYQAVLEGKASEEAARMVAMKNASDSAEQITEELRLRYNKARQAEITQEISEIVAGASAV